MYDLRRRGYDVTAKMCDTGTYVDKVVSDLYKGKAETLKPVFANSWGDVEKSVLKNFPEGSRGLFSINSPMLGMGHSMAFKVKDNKLKIIDAQCGNADVNIKSKKYKSFAPAYTFIKRLDNLEVNMKSVSHYSAELKDNWKKSVSKQKSERKMSESDVVSKYRKEHPNSKLSDKEIIENYTE